LFISPPRHFSTSLGESQDFFFRRNAALDKVSCFFDIAAATAIWCRFRFGFPAANVELSNVSAMLSEMVS
jgi:hypothetical protein